MKYLALVLLLLSGKAWATSGGLDANGNPQLPALTVSGAASFTSTMTVGPTSYSLSGSTATVSYASGIKGIHGTVILQSSVTAISNLYIVGLSSTAYTHWIRITGIKNTTGDIQLRVNYDATAGNYLWYNNGTANESAACSAGSTA